MNGSHFFYRMVGVNFIPQSEKNGLAKTGFLRQTHIIIGNADKKTFFHN